MEKIVPEKPILLLLYGFPGSGKTYFSRQFCEDVQAAHLEEDRLRLDLFEQPSYSKQENYAVNRIMDFMTNEFLNMGISVVLDTNAIRLGQRRALREMARSHKVDTLIVWFQVDADTAFIRNSKRDRRRLDDRYSIGYSVEQFREVAAHMQQPEPTEDFIVVSGKHSYNSQRSNVLKRLIDLKVLKHSDATPKMVRPDLVNLIPSGQKEEVYEGPRPIVFN